MKEGTAESEDRCRGGNDGKIFRTDEVIDECPSYEHFLNVWFDFNKSGTLFFCDFNHIRKFLTNQHREKGDAQ